QVLATVVGDEHDVLEPAPAVAGAVEARLDGDDVAGDEVGAHSAEARLLVHLEADAVPERVEEAVLEHLAGRLRELRRVTVGLEQLAGLAMEVGAADAGPNARDRPVERLTAEPVVLDELRGRLADDVGARQVREAGGLAVAREEVDQHRLAET